MRLAIVTHNVVRGDGQGRANYEIARFMLAGGHAVTLFADRVDTDLVEQGALWVPIQPKMLRQINLFKVWEFARAANLALHQRPGAFDIIHASGYCLDRAHDVNTSQFVHSAWIQSPMHTARQNRNLYGLYQWTYSALNARWERRVYAKAKVVVAASSTVRRELADLGVPSNRLRVILNGADTQEFHPGTEDRAALGLPVAPILGLFAGDLRTPRKNLDTVLKAVAQTPNIHLAVVGRTEGSPFPAMAQSLGIADRVHFLGFRRDIAAIMRAADLFIFPSRYEACALVLAEAIASGLPVITAKTTGGSELIGPDSGICLPDPNDAEALAAAIQTLSADPMRRHMMGDAARRTAETNTWGDIARQYLALYREICGDTGDAAG